MTEAKICVKCLGEMAHLGSGHHVGLESDKSGLQIQFHHLPTSLMTLN